FYKVMEKLMLTLVLLMLGCFIATLLLADIDVGKALGGLSPSIPSGSMGLVIAFTASCFSLVGAFYQAYLIQERRKINRGMPVNLKESEQGAFTGVAILGGMSAAVLICAAAVLFPKGIHVASTAEMEKALEPLFGKYASTFFFVGLFGSSFSSLVGNATLGVPCWVT